MTSANPDQLATSSCATIIPDPSAAKPGLYSACPRPVPGPGKSAMAYDRQNGASGLDAALPAHANSPKGSEGRRNEVLAEHQLDRARPDDRGGEIRRGARLRGRDGRRPCLLPRSADLRLSLYPRRHAADGP